MKQPISPYIESPIQHGYRNMTFEDSLQIEVQDQTYGRQSIQSYYYALSYGQTSASRDNLWKNPKQAEVSFGIEIQRLSLQLVNLGLPSKFISDKFNHEQVEQLYIQLLIKLGPFKMEKNSPQEYHLTKTKEALIFLDKEQIFRELQCSHCLKSFQEEIVNLKENSYCGVEQLNNIFFQFLQKFYPNWFETDLEESLNYYYEEYYAQECFIYDSQIKIAETQSRSPQPIFDKCQKQEI